MSNVDNLIDNLATMLYGMTPLEARSKQICISCGKHADVENWNSESVKEYHISALCPICFYTLVKEEDNA